MPFSPDEVKISVNQIKLEKSSALATFRVKQLSGAQGLKSVACAGIIVQSICSRKLPTKVEPNATATPEQKMGQNLPRTIIVASDSFTPLADYSARW